MLRQQKLMEGWEYMCRHCKLVYKVYGDSLRCDFCNRSLQLLHPRVVDRLLREWEHK